MFIAKSSFDLNSSKTDIKSKIFLSVIWFKFFITYCTTFFIKNNTIVYTMLKNMTKIMNRNLIPVYSETSIVLDINFSNELILKCVAFIKEYKIRYIFLTFIGVKKIFQMAIFFIQRQRLCVTLYLLF